VEELAASRAEIARQLERPIDMIAYPYGDTDSIVAHLASAVGYRFGFSCQPHKAGFQDDLLLLPRIEVSGLQNFAQFVKNLD
jgi:hypothetical protein